MTSFDSIRYLSRASVERVCPDASSIADRIEALLAASRQEEAWEAAKCNIHPAPGRQWMGLLSGAVEPSLAVFKTLGLSVDNATRGLPHIGSLIVVHDGESGLPMAVMDAGYITGVRTAAVTLIAARRMARADSASIAFIGCGVQALSHFDALSAEFPISQVVAFSRRRESSDALCEHARAKGCDARSASDARDAIGNADMVVSSIPEQPGFTPFLDAHELTSGVFVSAVDLGRSWIDASFPAFDRIVVEDLEKHDAAPMVTTAPVTAGLAELIQESRRTDAEARHAFIFRGLAFGDLAAASLCLERAVEADEGVKLQR